MRLLPPFLCLLSACGSLSGDAAQDLHRYQHNAQLYWDGGKLDQAVDQIERGLAIAPDDYKLQSLKAMVLLRQSQAGGTAGERRLQESEATFQRVYATRSPARHERHVLLGYGMALQAQGTRNLIETQRLRDAAGRAGANSAEGAAALARAAEHEAIGRSKLMQAREVLVALQTRGDLPRLASYHSMQIAAALGDHAATIAHGAAYLEASKRDQQWQQNEIARTSSIPYERERRLELQRLRQEELDTRTLLASLHHERGEFQKALEHLDVVLELDPGRSADYYNRGRCLRELGRVEAAKADFRRFLATSDLPAGNPKMTEAVRALEMR
jgi:tetratricopeptide (TPR) repeat protein